MPITEKVKPTQVRSKGLPARKGPRPRTVRGPLHIQCNGHGDPKYLNRFLDNILTWPHIESTARFVGPPDIIPIRLKEIAATGDPSAFITDREFARILLGAPTIYLALPLVSAHRAIVRGWAEPHYLVSYGLMPAGTVIVYTPKDEEELEACNFLFSESYHFACKYVGRDG
jgi:hypothetical protein